MARALAHRLAHVSAEHLGWLLSAFSMEWERVLRLSVCKLE